MEMQAVVVLDPPVEGQDYWVFPHEVLRHSWVIVRLRRPYVPVLQGAKVPNAATSPTDSAKYFSLFFRPWTFQSCDAGIPHISMLGLQHLNDSSTDMSRLPVRSYSGAKPRTPATSPSSGYEIVQRRQAGAAP